MTLAKMMILQVEQWPFSQDLMEDPEWFFVDDGKGHVGDNAYARDISEHIDVIVDYLWTDEKKHYEEEGKPKNHIFNHLKVIAGK